jgi:hypothetical protein
VFAVYSCRHHVDAKIKTFIDFLTSHLREALDRGFLNGRRRETFSRLARVVENV